MATLVDTLTKYPIFQELPIDKQHVYQTLATYFETEENALYLSPTELTTQLSIGNAEQWAFLLSLEPTKNFIKKELAERTQIAQRKALQSLQFQAANGNVAAAKEINEVAGIYDKQNNNQIVVLHRVNRPKVQTKEEQLHGNES